MSLLDRLFPPRGKIRIPKALARGSGNGDAALIGEKWARAFHKFHGLNGKSRVLDIGCGCGRMAIGIGERFGWTNAYVGFDVKAEDIDFCRREIGERHPGYRFERLDVLNGLYNPSGALKATEVRFPAGDASIDFAFAMSVFTHMRPEDVQHYLGESRRVLRPGGTLVASFYCLRDGMAEQRSFIFAHPIAPDCFVDDPASPEQVVAYRAEAAQAMFERAGFTDVRFTPGAWAGGEGRHHQDLFVARA